MPWNPLRPDRPSEKDLRRRSVLDVPIPTSTTPFAPINYGSQQQTRRSAEPPRRFRDSVVSLSAVNDSPVLEPVGSATTLQGRTPKQRPFSMLRFRHASDSQLSKTAKEHADAQIPPVPTFSFPTPSIITTAPTQDNLDNPKRKQAFVLPRRLKSPNPAPASVLVPFRTPLPKESLEGRNINASRQAQVTIDKPENSRSATAPPAYGDEVNSALALPVTRLSESSRSDESSGDHGVFATTTTTHTVSTTTTFFRLPRRKKDKGPLFPLPPRISTSDRSPTMTPRFSTSGRPSDSPVRQSFSTPSDTSEMRGSGYRKDAQPSPIGAALALTSATFAAPASDVLRSDSTASRHSERSTATTGHPAALVMRGRSSTMSSLRRAVEDDALPTPPLPQSTRTSTSTTGRASLGGLFNLSRLRQSSEPVFGRSGLSSGGTPGTPGSTGSKQNSFSLSREPAIVVPERQEGDTPAKYLARLEEVVNRGAIAALLSKSDDEFSKNVLRSYMRRFKFFEDPLDMAVRKMLMHVELPKETQHIDRTLQSFADRYHECNPGIFATPDEAYFIAFSILILHTDVFNKNNKHKMQKSDYTKNTRGQGVAQEILECFYDNIAYTPFIHVEDEVEITGDKILAAKSRTTGFKGHGKSSLRKSGTGPVDPYALILDSRLDTLRTPLDDVLVMQDPFTYMGSGISMNLTDLHKTFFKSGVIQILSSRSRPDAFLDQSTITNPLEARPGVVDVKITKVGLLWRKDTKKKKARSPWQEWGAILTGSQLYFFRNTSWIRSLIVQHENHHKQGRSNTPVVFKPPIESLNPDFLISTEDVVALMDSQYKKHKHAFVFTRQNVQNMFQEVFLADSDAEMNDWLAKLNYAAAFRTAGVRMRGVVGGHYEDSNSVESSSSDRVSSSHSINGPRGEVTIRKGRLGDELAQQIKVARRQILAQKISEANEKLVATEKQLDGQLRNARHIQILAPIQQKTREEIEFAALRLATSIRWARIETWRIRCHRDILAMDLEEDIRLGSRGENQPTEQRPSGITSAPQSANPDKNKPGFNRLSSRNSNPTSITSKHDRPGTQPSGGKLFSMEDIFRSPTRLLSQHKTKGSWELPPLAFDRKSSVSTNRNTTPLSIHVPLPEQDKVDKNTVVNTVVSMTLADKTEVENTAASIAMSAERDDHAERDLLVEAGLFSPESTISDATNLQDIPSDDERSKIPDVDGNDSLSKVRHSLHRKLQSAHVPSHHRSKKGKDSSSSAAVTDDTASIAESEGLPRGTGSFTVHGKKASVITFGSEWHKMSPEDRLKLRKQAHMEESKLSVPPSMEDDTVSTSGRRTSHDFRPMSARSTSTATTKSLGRLTAAESHPADAERPLSLEYHDAPEICSND